ncbi:MAG: hypothetical protein APR54_04950 [Candidatus Cloacimonas sp. SDB]|nr:MAG: hypothetical protein APR54_04950 [Candidatus Cloacimonas sp. SDB]
MNLEITYGNVLEKLEINRSNLIDIITPKEKNAGDEIDLIREALRNPLQSQSLKDFLKDGTKLLVIVNDATRATPTAKVLKVLSEYWQKCEVKFIVATGAHVAPEEDELKKIFGSSIISNRKSIHVHDAVRDPMKDLGITSRGVPVKFNRIISEVDKIINVNSVEPHYFAGFTGGRKSFQPGIASYESIEKNHALALDPDAQILRLKGNPVHEDMMEAAEKIDKEIFSVMTVTDCNNRICDIAAGNWQTTFEYAARKAEEIYSRPCKKKADIMVSVVKPPLNLDLYQAQKGVENSRAALKDNGILILVSECRGGIGKDEFYKLLSSCKNPKDVFEKIRQGYKLGYHKAAKLADFSTNFSLWMVTEIEREILAKIFIRKFDTVALALKKAMELKGSSAEIIFNLDSGTTVPVVRQNNRKQKL